MLLSWESQRGDPRDAGPRDYFGPLPITALGLQDDGMEEHEERVARQRVAEAGLGRIDELGNPEWIGTDSVERARNLLDYRRRRFGAPADGDGDGCEGRTDACVD